MNTGDLYTGGENTGKPCTSGTVDHRISMWDTGDLCTGGKIQVIPVQWWKNTSDLCTGGKIQVIPVQRWKTTGAN